MQAEAGLLVNGGGGGGGVTEAWVEEHFVPILPLVQSATVHNGIKNDTNLIVLECKDDDSNYVNQFVLNPSAIELISILNGTTTSTMLQCSPRSIEYRRFKNGQTLIGEIATLDDIPAGSTVVTDGDTITGDGTSTKPLTVNKELSLTKLTIGASSSDYSPYLYAGSTYHLICQQSNTQLFDIYMGGFTVNVDTAIQNLTVFQTQKFTFNDCTYQFYGLENRLRMRARYSPYQPETDAFYTYINSSDDIYTRFYGTTDFETCRVLSNIQLCNTDYNNAFTFSVPISTRKTLTLWQSIKEVYNINCNNENLFTMTFNGNFYANNTSNMTVTHLTEVSEPEIGRFCETTGEVHDYGQIPIGITDCICKVKTSTILSNRILGIITTESQLAPDGRSSPCGSFASHGDVLVVVDDGEYHLGDLLVPTLTGSRVATDEDKLFIMLNGLPRVRVTCVDANVLPKINDKVCVACFIS
jgi:hypothetical protein